MPPSPQLPSLRFCYAEELNAKTLDNSTGNDTLNFIIKLSWDESAKETDVIYLIARNTSGK